MNLSCIKNSLDSINRLYRKLILTSNYVVEPGRTSWAGYKPGIYNKILYAREYELLLDSRQYSFLLVDKSFFQFFYEFDVDKKLTKAKLCYYPFPVECKDVDRELEEYFDDSGTTILEAYYLGMSGLRELGIIASNSSHIRLDYDNEVTSHCKGHLQYSAINELRIPLNHMFDPLIFFDFIIAQSKLKFEGCYPAIVNSQEHKTAKARGKNTVYEISKESGLNLQYSP